MDGQDVKQAKIRELAKRIIWRALKDLVDGRPTQRVEAAAWVVGNDAKTIAYAAGIPPSQVREIGRYLALAPKPEARRILRRLAQQKNVEKQTGRRT